MGMLRCPIGNTHLRIQQMKNVLISAGTTMLSTIPKWICFYISRIWRKCMIVPLEVTGLLKSDLIYILWMGQIQSQGI